MVTRKIKEVLPHHMVTQSVLRLRQDYIEVSLAGGERLSSKILTASEIC